MRFGIIGTGNIVSTMLAAAADVPDFTLTAVYSRNQTHAEEFAAKHGAPYAFSDLGALAACPEVDAVYIASPNYAHCEQAVKMLHAGKHVLCEKPIASNSRELSAMLKAAKEGGAVLLEAYRHILSPAFEVIRAQIPKLGEIRRVSLVFNQYSSRYDNYKKGVIENAFDPTLSNGAIMDIGGYCVSLLTALFGAPKAIDARALKLSNGVDGQGAILAEYDGMLAEISYSKIADAFTPSVIQGEKGSLIIPHVTHSKYFTLRMRGGIPEEIPSGETKVAKNFVGGADNNLSYELETFIRIAEAGTGQEFYNRCSEMTMAVMDEARRQQGVVFPADKSSAEV